MKDFIEIDNRRYRCTWVQKEIRFKGKAYAIARELRGASAPEAADAGSAHLLRNGAREIFFSCKDADAAPLPDVFDTPAGRTFRHVYDMDWLEKDLTGLAPPKTALSLALLEKRNRAAFRRIYNECFFSIPASTYTRTDIQTLLVPDASREAGLVLEAGQPIGTYELSFDETPEIQGLGITSAKREMGYGRQALGLIADALRRRGFSRAGLLVCTANKTAYGLYLKEGFEKQRTQSRWYLMD